MQDDLSIINEEQWSILKYKPTEKGPPFRWAKQYISNENTILDSLTTKTPVTNNH